MNNPFLKSFDERVDIGKLRVARPSNVIFFCGGPRNPDENAEPYSARDFILRKLLINRPDIYGRLYYEESMLEWFRDGHYTDLLSFEKHISEISSIVFLIAESPGSFSELGTFANEPSINEKLIVMISNENDDDTTYLALGPIKYLRENDEAEVIAYDWASEFHSGAAPKINTADLEEIWGNVIESVEEYERNSSIERQFQCDTQGHISLLIIDLLCIFGALKHNELLNAVSKIVGNFEKADLQKHLFLLEKMDLVFSMQRGQKFFLARHNESHIYYDFLTGTAKEISNRGRLTFLARDWFKKQDPNRFKVIQRHAVGGEHE